MGPDIHRSLATARKMEAALPDRILAPFTAPKEVALAIMGVHHVPSLTQERYGEVVCRLTNGKRRLESPSDLPFEGLLVHVAAETENGFLIFDVFESEEAVARFSEAVEPIAKEVGIEDPPKTYPAHTFISG